MVAYVIFIKERTHNQGELDVYKEMAPAALAGHPITFRIAHGHKEVVKGRDFEDMMMLEFPTFREARAWYDSPASTNIDLRTCKVAGSTLGNLFSFKPSAYNDLPRVRPLSLNPDSVLQWRRQNRLLAENSEISQNAAKCFPASASYSNTFDRPAHCTNERA
jgi:uncharacterized protein (DUF1330 family)